MTESHDSSSTNERLEEILAGYLRAEEEGEPRDEAALMREHPDLAGELASFFANRRAMSQVAARLREHELPTAGADEVARPLPGQGPAGREFGDYELEREIARGGMGVVYQARQRSLQRIVALKTVLAGQSASPVDLARFRQEAEAAARLEHPCIVPVYEVGEHNGWCYYTMQLIEGGNLLGQVAALRANPEAAARLVEQVARAVHFAHQHGILHRDLKPANILIDDQGRPHVTDFGLARVLDSQSRMTQTGAALGTPGYMAPEQIRGERSLTTAVDVYSLGAVLFACLTGKPPFQSDNALQALQLALDSEPPLVRSLNSRVDRDLETICRKALERDPKRRYESAAAFADDLMRWLAHEPIAARPPSVTRRIAKWTRRHPAWTTVIAAACLLSVLGLIQLKVTWSALTRERLASERSESLLYRTLLALAEREWSAGAIQNAREALGKCPESRRGWEWTYARRLCLVTPANTLGDFDQPIVSGGFSDLIRVPGKDDQGERICAVDATGRAWVWESSGLEVATFRVEAREHAPQAALSPDGQRLALACAGKVELYDLQTRQQLWSSEVPGFPRRLAFAPSGDRIGVLSYAGPLTQEGAQFSLLSVDGATVATIPLGPARDEQGAWFLFTPDERVLVYPRLDPNHDFRGPPEPMRVFHSRTGERIADEPIAAPDQPGDYSCPLAISPEGQRLVQYYSLGNPHLRIRRIDDGATVRVPLDSGNPFGYTFSHDGRLMAYITQDMNIDFDEHRLRESPPKFVSSSGELPDRQAWILTVHLVEADTGREVGVMRGVPGNQLQLTFSPDGRRLLGLGGAAKASDRGIARSLGVAWIWEVPARQTARVIRASDEAVRDVLVTSDGRRIVAGGDDKKVRIWDAHSGALLRELKGHSEPIQSLACGKDPNKVLSVGGGEVIAWDCETGESRVVLGNSPAESLGELHGVAVHPDGTRAALARSGAMGDVLSYHVEQGRTLFRVPGTPQFPAFSPDGKWLAIPYQFDLHGELKIVDAENGKPLRHWRSADQPLTLRTGWGYLRAAFSPDRRHVAVVGNIGGADLYDMHTGRLARRLRGHGTTVWDVEFTPDGSRLATSGHADRTVKLWSVATGEEVHTLRGHEGWVTGLAFSPDGSRLVTASTEGTVRIWEAR